MRNAGRRLASLAAAALLAGLGLAGPGLADPSRAAPAIFFYPPPYALPDGSLLASPLTVEASQITTGFPATPEMAGVSLIVYWSRLCFVSDAACDFKLIDDTLAYWRQRGKKVVLGVATIGFPVKSFRGGAAHFENATPAWALRDAGSYDFQTKTLGAIGGEHEIAAAFPRFWDPHFLADTRRLVDHLKKYDGDPALAQIRIATGLMTEDNPMVGHLNAPMAGYDESQWLDYCRAVFALYRAAFHRTQIEFDIGRLAVAYGRGTPAFRAGVDAFFAQLQAAHVFLAYNGLRDTDLAALKSGDERTGPPFALHRLADALGAGNGAGLEGAPLTSPRGGGGGGAVHAVR
jgi:hypothetical protein